MERYNYDLVDLVYLREDNPSEIKKFLRFKGVTNFDDYDIAALLALKEKINTDNRWRFNVSYIVERLNKEFDLVKIGDNVIVNIELKTANKDVEQCLDNYDLLCNFYPDYETYTFCFESEKNAIYLINPETKIMEISNYEKLNALLEKIKNPELLKIHLDISSVYLYPDFFLNKKYRLSSGQKTAKTKVIEDTDNQVSLICGRAGTGKSLLALDLFDYYQSHGFKVIYLAPFKVNSIVSSKIIEKIGIMTIKQFKMSGNTYDICIVDEAQRVSQRDMDFLKEKVNTKIILLGDIHQNINSEYTFQTMYEDKVGCLVHTIKQIVRTDDTFDLYAKKVLDLPYGGIKNKRIDKNRVSIDLIDPVSIKGLDDYIYLEPAKSLYFSDCRDTCSHKDVCIQVASRCSEKRNPYNSISIEYKNVLLLFCDGYKIVDGKIVSIKDVCVGNLQRQLYSLMTRATEKMKILTDNIEIYNFLNEKKEEL